MPACIPTGAKHMTFLSSCYESLTRFSPAAKNSLIVRYVLNIKLISQTFVQTIHQITIINHVCYLLIKHRIYDYYSIVVGKLVGIVRRSIFFLYSFERLEKFTNFLTQYFS